MSSINEGVAQLRVQLKRGWESMDQSSAFLSPGGRERGGAGGEGAKFGLTGRMATTGGGMKWEDGDDGVGGGGGDDEGHGGGSELEMMSKQLNSQMEHNNDLLRELAEMEKQHLASQREMSERQAALRQAVGACEMAKAEVNELKFRLASAQEITARAIEESNNAKVEAGIKAREVEGLRRFVEEAKDELASLQLERVDLLRDLEQIKAERNKLREELHEKEEEFSAKEAEHRADFEALNREVAQTKARLSPLEGELRAERTRADELADTLKDKNEALHDLSEKYENEKAIVTQLTDQVFRAAQDAEQLKSELEQKNQRLQQAEQQVQAARELSLAEEADKNNARKKIADLTRINHELDDEVKDLKIQLEGVGNDLHSQTVARRQDRELMESKLADVREELARVIDTARANDRRLGDELAKKEAEFARQRRDAEETHARAQEENRQLNSMLQNLQNDLATQLTNFQAERENYDQRIAAAIDAQKQAEARVNQRDSRSSQEVASLREQLLELQKELTRRTQVYVETLGTLEATLHQCAGECQKLQAAHDSLLDEVEGLRGAIRDYADRGETQIEAWHGETKRSLSELADATVQSKAEASAAREAQHAAESQRDEERSRTFMLEEERARLEDELNDIQEKLRNLEQSTNERLKAAKTEAEVNNAAKADLESQIRRLQQQLEKANSQNRSLQQDNERSNANVADIAARNKKRIQDLEEKTAKLENDLKEALAARDSALAEYSLLKKKQDGSTNELEALQAELRKLESSQRDSGLQEQKTQATYQRQIATLTEGMRKQQTQLTQTKSLLSVVQEQRKHLQDEVIQLRSELDRYLVRSLNESKSAAGLAGEEEEE